MCLLLALFLCSAIVERCGGPSHFSRNSRLGEFNSRLGPNKFPGRRLRELAHKGLIYLAVSGAETALCGNNRKNSRLDGKNREIRPRRNQRASRHGGDPCSAALGALPERRVIRCPGRPFRALRARPWHLRQRGRANRRAATTSRRRRFSGRWAEPSV